MYDVSAKHINTLEENDKAIEALKKSNPDDYFLLPEFRKICEENRQANHQIEEYDSMIKMGVKFRK